MKFSATRRTGFTIIELLIVIAIIVMLMALPMPALQAVRARARDAQSINNLKQIGGALKAYDNQFGVLPPTKGQTTANQPTRLQGIADNLSTTPHGGILWKTEFLKDPGVLLDPTDTSGNGVFSYSMPLNLGLKPLSRADRPSEDLFIIQEDPFQFLSSYPNDTFYHTDRPAATHAGSAATLFLDVHADLIDWTQYAGHPGYSRTPTGTMPIASQISIRPWGRIPWTQAPDPSDITD